MKKHFYIGRYFLLMLVIFQVMIQTVLPVHAGVRVNMVDSGIRITGDSFAGGSLMLKTYNGLPVYCVQPHVDFSTQDVYQIGYLEEYSRLNATQKEHIAEYSYFGYGYSGASSSEDYAATQYLIWLEIDGNFVKGISFFSERTGANVSGAVQQSVQRIINAVNSYRSQANFDISGPVQRTNAGSQFSASAEAGSTFEFSDRNGVLHNMHLVQNDFGTHMQWQADHLNISLSKDTYGDRTLRFEGSTNTVGTRPLLLSDAAGNFQTLFVRGDIRQSVMIRLHTTFSVELIKEDEKGSPVAGASLQVLDGTQAVDAWQTDHTSHVTSGLEYHQYSLAEKDAPLGYYYAQDQTFQPGEQISVKMIETPIHASIIKEDEDGHYVIGTVLELTDENDGRIQQITTGEKPYDCGPFLKADHTYRIKELQSPTGYYYAQDAEFTVPHFYEGKPIEIVLTDPKIHYTVFKQDENGRAVKDASLSLYDVTSPEKKLVKTWLSGPDAQEIGDALDAGHSYCITENDVGTKYFLAVDQTFAVSKYEDQPTHELSITDHHIHYELEKVDENGNAVKDARLLITDITDPLDDSRVVLDWRSTEEPLTVNLFERGHVYRLQELEGPDGYYKAEDKTFKVPEYGTSDIITVTCEDDHIVYKIIKIDDQGRPVENAELAVYEKTEQGEVEVKSFMTGKEPEMVFGLKNNTDYVVKELHAPKGYYIAKEYPFHVNETGTSVPIEIRIVNQPIETIIRKTDSEGRQLAGAVLKVTDQTSGEIVGTYDTKAEEDIKIGSALTAGHTYVVEENSAPTGYYKAEDTIVKISEEYQNGLNQVIEIVDQPIHITVIKTDLDDQPLPDAHLALMQGDNTLVSWVSDGSECDISSYLCDGMTYEVKETEAPSGYYRSLPQQFTVDSHARQSNRTVKVKNIPIQYEIIKTDENGSPVAGVQLKLSEKTGEEYRMIRTWTTTQTSEKFTAELSADHQYLLEETAQTAGYHEAQSMTFTVSETGTPQSVVIQMVDETNNISFLKIDEKGNPLPNAEMEILDQNGNLITSFLTGESPSGISLDRTGNQISSLLMSGSTYILHEKNAPFGYDVCADTSFQMNGSNAVPQIFILQDMPKTMYLKIDKRSSADNQPLLSDCEVTVFNAKTNEAAFDLRGEKASGVTDENGAVEFHLPYTSDGYYVQETKAPKGYAIDEKKKELLMDQDEFFHAETPQEIHVVDNKSVDTASQLPYHAIMALLCVIGCFLLMKRPDEKA